MRTLATAIMKSACSCRGQPVPSNVVENKSPILRFGIMANGKRSSYWRVRAGVAKPELFMEREGFGKKWHFSLHASEQLHMKESGKERINWTRPSEVIPGYTRAVSIVQPVVVAQRRLQAPQWPRMAITTYHAGPETVLARDHLAYWTEMAEDGTFEPW